MIDIANVQYRLVIMDEKGKQYNIKDYVDDLGWEQGEKELSTRISFTTRNEKSTQGLLSSIAKLGCLVGIFATDGKKDEEVARGYITTWKPSYSSDSDRFDVKCYDNLYNLQESQDNIYYSSGIGTKSAITKIFDNWEIPLGSYSGPNETHAKLAYKSESLADVILDILDEYDVKTTFFLVDIWTQKYPELVKEIVARGHEIGNHSTSHPQMSKLNETQIAKELNTQADNVLAIAGVRPVLFRPPYGDYNNRVITTARAQGFVPIQWSVDSLDWKNRGAQEIINRATKVKSGDIVLFHNDSQYILDALPAVLKYYAENGYSVVPISEILLTGETTIDIQGRQQPVSTKIPEV